MSLAEPGSAIRFREKVAAVGLVRAVVAVLVAVADVAELDAEAVVAAPLVMTRQRTHRT